MANRIYLGPNDRQPKAITNKPVTGAGFFPGTFVAERDTGLIQPAAFTTLLRLLGEPEFSGDFPFDATNPLKSPYNTYDSAHAYVIEPGQRYRAVVAAGSYVFGGALSITTGGRLAASTGTQMVVAYYKGVNGPIADGELVDIEIANFHPHVA